MTIWAHTLVCNEERYIWYAVMSVIEYVDKILIWDTGSTDSTIPIIHAIKKYARNKVDFKEVGEVTRESFTHVRQEMLEVTSADWVLIVDGDEVWSEEGLKELHNSIEQRNLDVIVSPFWSIVGDIFHFQEERAGKYTIGGKTGHLTIRAFRRNLQGLHVAHPFHQGEGFYSEPKRGTSSAYDDKGRSLQEQRRLFFQKEKYFHFDNLRRSRFDEKTMERKVVYEKGISFPSDFYYPEVFFKKRPPFVPSPWYKLSGRQLWKAHSESPLRGIKRRVWK